MESLQKYLSQIRIPSANQHIYKDECVYSFDNPRTPTGLFVSLTSFLGFGKAYVEKYAVKTGYMVYLHIREEKIKLAGADDDSDAGKVMQDDKDGVPNCKITRLAIGIEGGYTEANDSKKYAYKQIYNVVVIPDYDEKIPYPNDELPLIVKESIAAILAQDSNILKIDKEMLTGTWDGEIRQNSKFSDDLKQLDNGKKIPPSNWKCEKCDLKSNLWLNLTDGAILCGRKFFDGSGGNDHAVQHYREFGYPLAVKLGTIASGGKADVFSYAEDDMVIDTKLEEHLKHFGINMSAMKKSEKSMVELELEINQRIGEWSLLTESSGDLLPLSGPGYTGIRNLGNSCYISSVMQVLFHIKDFKKRFVGAGAEYYFAKFPEDPINDFNIQMAKLGNGLWSGKYSIPSSNAMDCESANGISPTMFKYVVGRNHADFSTKQQQDAHDFFLHLITLMERNSLNEPNPMNALKFAIEERVECASSKKVKYTRRDEYCLPLQLPLEKATNLEEIKEYKAKKEKNKAGKEEPIRHRIPLHVCLERFFSTEHIDQFFSTAIKGITTAKKTSRLVNMPDYLMMHLRKFTLGDDWVPKKLDVSIEMPDIIDLSEWRASGMQPGEEELPNLDGTEKAVFNFDENIINALMQMGFPQEACKRAAFHTKNGGLEIATNWIMEHIGDSDFSDPFIIPDNVGNGNKNKNSTFVPNPESLSMLVVMGFQERLAIKALKATGGNLERATDWIFSHADEVDMEDMDTATSSSGNQHMHHSYRDGMGKYRLMAFISHMGTSAQVGHYVCHILKDGKWVIFNDNKVAVSQKPPKDLGYLYLYKREE